MDNNMYNQQNESRVSSGYSSGSDSELNISYPYRLTTRGRPRRRDRTLFSPDDLDMLETSFKLDKYPDIRQREEIADRLGVLEDRIQVWFQNRRSRDKKEAKRRVLVAQRLASVKNATETQKQPSPAVPPVWYSHQTSFVRCTPYYVTPQIPFIQMLPQLYNNPVITNRFHQPPSWILPQRIPKNEQMENISMKCGMNDSITDFSNISGSISKKFVPKRPWEDNHPSDPKKRLKFSDCDDVDICVES